MGRQGTLAYWLVHMLSFVTGRLDVEGGNLKSDGFYPNARAGAAPIERMYVDSEFGRVRRGGLPGTLMSHAILDSDQPLKALIVLAGNPVLSIGGEERLRKAFEQLDLLVCIDIYRNATGELADWVLPATDQFERDDLNIVNIGTSHRPFAQYTPAVVEPAGERKPEWWIVAALLQAMGRPSLLDDETPDRGRSGGTCSPGGASTWPRWPTRCTSSSRRRPAGSTTSRCTPPTAASIAARRRSPRRSSAARRSSPSWPPSRPAG